MPPLTVTDRDGYVHRRDVTAGTALRQALLDADLSPQPRNRRTGTTG